MISTSARAGLIASSVAIALIVTITVLALWAVNKLPVRVGHRVMGPWLRTSSDAGGTCGGAFFAQDILARGQGYECTADGWVALYGGLKDVGVGAFTPDAVPGGYINVPALPCGNDTSPGYVAAGVLAVCTAQGYRNVKPGAANLAQWAGCGSTTQCKDPNQPCLLGGGPGTTGHARCLTKADCLWAHHVNQVPAAKNEWCDNKLL